MKLRKMELASKKAIDIIKIEAKEFPEYKKEKAKNQDWDKNF